MAVEKNWVLHKDAVEYGSEYANWVEVIDYSDKHSDDVFKEIQSFSNNEHLRDSSYIFVCKSPNKVRALLDGEINYAYFKYCVTMHGENQLLNILANLR